MKAPVRPSSHILVLALASLVSLLSLASTGCATTQGTSRDSSLEHPYRERFVAIADSPRSDVGPNPIAPSKDRTRAVRLLWH